jgi:glycine cleavage system protein P-like pyridoxal-binding family
VGFIALGAGNNEYVTSYQGRNYNFGSGARGKLEVFLEHQTFGRILADYNYFSIYTREGVPGVDRVHVFNANYMIKILGPLGIGVEFIYYLRNANYKNDPDITRQARAVRGLIGINF